MTRRFPIVEISLAAAAFVLLVTIAVQRENLKAQAAYDTFSTFDYRSGGYRAWFDLLDCLGRKPERFERYPVFLDGSVATLIAADPLPFTDGGSVSEANAAALARWVRDGGRLVLIGQGALSDALAKELAPPDVAVQAPRKGAVPILAPSFAAAGVRRIAAAGSSRFAPAKGVEVLLADERGSIVVRKRAGKGELIAVADQQPFTNSHIASLDNARLATALATVRPGGSLAFDESLHGYLISEHWWQLVPGPFLVAIGFTLAAVALGAIGAAVRLGPPILPRKRREATSSEYIDALAALFERAGASGHAITTAYISTRRAIARSLGFPDEIPDAELAAHLGTGRLRGAFSELASLANTPAPAPAALVRGVALAQSIRKDVGSGGR